MTDGVDERSQVEGRVSIKGEVVVLRRRVRFGQEERNVGQVEKWTHDQLVGSLGVGSLAWEFELGDLGSHISGRVG